LFEQYNPGRFTIYHFGGSDTPSDYEADALQGK
jgi:hypothetical protein